MIDEPEVLFRSVLKLSKNENIKISKVTPGSRNIVWYGQLSNEENGYYLKIQDLTYPSRSIEIEADVLTVADPKLLGSPRLLGHGVCSDGNTHYLVTEELPGSPADRQYHSLPFYFFQFIEWLKLFQTQAPLIQMGEKLSADYIGRFSKTFNPYKSAMDLANQIMDFKGGENIELHLVWCSKINEELFFQGHGLVHGSFTPNNILTSHNNAISVLDFEGLRLGPAHTDAAMMGRDLLLMLGPEVAKRWIESYAAAVPVSHTASLVKVIMIDLIFQFCVNQSAHNRTLSVDSREALSMMLKLLH